MAIKTLVNFLTVTLFSAFILAYPIAVKAQTSSPIFPSCVNPSGTLKVSYDTGIHGVPGRTVAYGGKDVVYSNTNGNYTQCLCTVNGEGVQTNWWKTGSLTEEELNILKADNWFYIPDGSLWGLEQGSYMAKNLDYACITKPGDTSTGTGGGDGGQVQGASTTRFGQVLGLATTGTLPVIAGYLLLGSLALVLGRKLIK